MSTSTLDAPRAATHTPALISTASTHVGVPAGARRIVAPGRKLLVFVPNNPHCHFWFAGMAKGAAKAGLGVVSVVGDDWDKKAADTNAMSSEMNELLYQQRIGATLNVTNWLNNRFPSFSQPNGPTRSYFEVRNVPELFFWLDHPQWKRYSLEDANQAPVRSNNAYHFMKCQAHADELSRVLGWPNTFGLHSGVDTELLRPTKDVEPEYDCVSVYQGVATLPEWCRPFLDLDDPDPREMNAVYAKQIRADIRAIWKSKAPANLTPMLEALGDRLVDLKLAHPTFAITRLVAHVHDEFAPCLWWLTANSSVYFAMCECLWWLRRWQRFFVPAYLAKYHRVAIFGGDWSALGVETGPYVPYEKMPAAFARGHVALNIVNGMDEEGLTAKTFEIAAGGSAILNNDCLGLDEAFDIGTEVETFVSPREAREKITELKDNPAKRKAMGEAARARCIRDHTWENRVLTMLRLAGFDPNAFRA